MPVGRDNLNATGIAYRWSWIPLAKWWRLRVRGEWLGTPCCSRWGCIWPWTQPSRLWGRTGRDTDGRRRCQNRSQRRWRQGASGQTNSLIYKIMLLPRGMKNRIELRFSLIVSTWLRASMSSGLYTDLKEWKGKMINLNLSLLLDRRQSFETEPFDTIVSVSKLRDFWRKVSYRYRISIEICE